MKALTYQEENERNQKIFSDMVKRIRPDIWVLMDIIDKTGVNPFVLMKTTRQIYNIAVGSGWGEVSILIMNKRVANVSGKDTEKLNEPAITRDGGMEI